MASALDTVPTVVPVLAPSPRELALGDQLDAAGRHVTTLELRVNRLEREVIAERALREELEREVADLRRMLDL